MSETLDETPLLFLAAPIPSYDDSHSINSTSSSGSNQSALPDYTVDDSLPKYPEEFLQDAFNSFGTTFKAKHGIFTITFSCPVPNAAFPIYTQLDRISGKVEVEIEEGVKLKNIYVNFKGRAQTSYQLSAGRARAMEIKDVCQFLTILSKIWSIDRPTLRPDGTPYIPVNEDHTIPPGKYKLPFSLEIPRQGICVHGKNIFTGVKLMQSCKFAALGSIQSVYYFLEVTADPFTEIEPRLAPEPHKITVFVVVCPLSEPIERTPLIAESISEGTFPEGLEGNQDDWIIRDSIATFGGVFKKSKRQVQVSVSDCTKSEAQNNE